MQRLLNWPQCSWVHWISFGLGSGLMPFAPGTWGSLVGLLIGYIFAKPSFIFWCATVFVICLSFWSVPKTSSALHCHDHKSIVIDEVAGQLFTYCLISPLFDYWTNGFFILGFLAFRLFDVYKIGWADYFDQQRNHSSVTLDDLCAGLYAGGSIWLVTILLFISSS